MVLSSCLNNVAHVLGLSGGDMQLSRDGMGERAGDIAKAAL
jgi:hypothetical protein